MVSKLKCPKCHYGDHFDINFLTKIQYNLISKLFYSHILIENKLGDYKPWKQYKKYSTIPPNPHKALPTTRLSLSHFKETHGNAYPNPRYVDPTDPDIFKDTKVTRKKGKGFSNVGNLKTLREKNHGK